VREHFPVLRNDYAKQIAIKTEQLLCMLNTP